MCIGQISCDYTCSSNYRWRRFRRNQRPQWRWILSVRTFLLLFTNSVIRGSHVTTRFAEMPIQLHLKMLWKSLTAKSKLGSPLKLEAGGASLPKKESEEMQKRGSGKSESTDVKSAAKPLICFECKYEGHRASECPKRYGYEEEQEKAEWSCDACNATTQ